MAANRARDFDLAVIGSGGAAFAAAIRATNLGKRVVMIERSTLGGTCVNTGCVPSKALLAAAQARHVSLEAARFPGLASGTLPVTMSALVAGKDDLVEGLRQEKYADLIAEYGWELRRGDAAFSGTPTDPVLRLVPAGGAPETVSADHYLVATGSLPWEPPIEGLEQSGYLTSTSAMKLTEVPSSLLVIGGGYVAMEQAQIFSRLGSQVTMLVRSRLASREEPEASKAFTGAFADEGIQVVRHAVPSTVRRDPTTGEVVVSADVEGETQEFRAEQLLVATGRRAVTEGLDLDVVGVETGDNGHVVVDPTMRSTNPTIWAAGDVAGGHEFVYVAAAQGNVAADNALTGARGELDYRHLPRVVFTTPALAGVGMTERQAREAGVRCECRILPLHHVPRARVNRDARGLIKIVAELGTGRIVGITAVAHEAGELAAAGVYIIRAGMTVEQVANVWSPYLTMAEGLRIAAQAFTTDVTRLSCCAA